MNLCSACGTFHSGTKASCPNGEYAPTPVACPVCQGRGAVPNGFYTAIGVESWTSSNPGPETCRTCNGVGVLWLG